MSGFEYKVVPAPRRAGRVKGARSSQDRFAHTLTETINELSREGWEYMRAETLPCEERGSVLRKREEHYHSVLVFRRAVGAKAVADPRPIRPVEEAKPATLRHAPENPPRPLRPERAARERPATERPTAERPAPDGEKPTLGPARRD
ncbi:MAG: DUF4177 domain-containing protein [Pseudomonadota bacterium]